MKIWTEEFVKANPELAANAIETLIELAHHARNQTLDEIANKIAAMPFGDTAASMSIWVRDQKFTLVPFPQPSDLP